MEQAIKMPDEVHRIMKEYKDKEGVSIRKQVEILIKESPRYKNYVKEATK